jgi:cyclopropane-fatty-acyl-phospholipid synthase
MPATRGVVASLQMRQDTGISYPQDFALEWNGIVRVTAPPPRRIPSTASIILLNSRNEPIKSTEALLWGRSIMSATETASPDTKQTNLATFVRQVLEATGAACEVRLPSGETLQFGQTAPRFQITIHNDKALRYGLDELALSRSFVEGDIDLDGDMIELLDLRAKLLQGKSLLMRLQFLHQIFLRAPSRVNREAIAFHYNRGDDFYLKFIDNRYRFYSHGLFQSPSDTLEDSSEHKLETMYHALDLKPGMRLLDIGGGWGGTVEYCGQRGIHVTSLTIAKDSFDYINRLIARRNLPCEVIEQDFLTFVPQEPYDAIVIYGVIEHIPNYRKFCHNAWTCLRPGGPLYMDASAAKEKYSISPFTEQYIWSGAHSFMYLPDILQEFINHGFHVEEVVNETRDYELTMRHWAERFDAVRERIVSKWGEQTYRAFRLYLWGGCHAFHSDQLQAYHIVGRKSHDAGMRPGIMRRARRFLHSLT